MIYKILVAVDRSPRDKIVLDSALALAKNTGATLMLLEVLSEKEAEEPLLPSYSYYPTADDRNLDRYGEQLAQSQQWGIDRLRNLAEKSIAAGVKTEYTQLTGSPGQTICEIASNWSADLIVVGSRGLKGLKAMFLGSVSNYVTHHASCSVMVAYDAIANESDPDYIALDEKLATSTAARK